MHMPCLLASLQGDTGADRTFEAFFGATATAMSVLLAGRILSIPLPTPVMLSWKDVDVIKYMSGVADIRYENCSTVV